MRLAEAKYTDITPLGEMLEKYRGRGLWIHFSDPRKPERTPRDGDLPSHGLKQRAPLHPAKVGINPKKTHLDPPGVYFYPVDWLLTHDRFLEGEQWATNWPEYIIADIDTSVTGLDLSTASREEIEDLAVRNGWADQFHEYIDDMRNKGRMPDPAPEDFYADTAWGVLKSLNQRQNENRVSWLRALRGLNYVLDRNGIIMRQEPEQICVFNPKIITVVDRGTQRRTDQNDYDKFDHWRYFLVKLFRTLAKRHGGEVSWKAKRPVWVVSGEDWAFSITWRDSYSMGGLAVQMAKGPITDSHTINPKFLRDHDFADVVEKVESYLTSAQQMTTDGTFHPVISPEEATRLLKQIMHFANGEPLIDIRANTSSFIAELTRTQGRVPVKSMARISADEKSYTMRVEAKVNDQLVLYGSGTDPKSLWTSVSKTSQQIMTELTDETRFGNIDKEYVQPFLGYLYVCTGFAIFEEFEYSFYEANSGELYRQMERAFRKVGW